MERAKIRASRRAFWAPLLAITAGCGQGSIFVSPSWEQEISSRVRILTDRAGGVLEADAEPAGAPAIQSTLPPEAEALHLLYYPSSLEELGLTEGPLGEGGRCHRACELASPSSVESFALVDERPEPFEPAAEMRAALIEHILPEHATWCGTQCLRFETELVPLELNARIIGAVARPDGSVWIFADDRQTRVLSPAGDLYFGCTIANTSTLASVAADGRERAWVASFSGDLIAIPMESAPTAGLCPEAVRSPSLSFEALHFLAAANDPDGPDEVFGIGHAGGLWRFSPREGWQDLGAFMPPDPNTELRYSAGALLWLGSGRALGVRDTREILVTEAGETESSYVNVGGSDRLIAGRITESGQIQLSAQGAGLIEAATPAGPWSVKLALPFEVVSAFMPLDDHLLLVQKRALEARHAELGSCAVAGVENAGLIKLLIPLPGGKDFVIADFSGNPASGEIPQRYALIVRTKRPCDP